MYLKICDIIFTIALLTFRLTKYLKSQHLVIWLILSRTFTINFFFSIFDYKCLVYRFENTEVCSVHRLAHTRVCFHMNYVGFFFKTKVVKDNQIMSFYTFSSCVSRTGIYIESLLRERMPLAHRTAIGEENYCICTFSMRG